MPPIPGSLDANGEFVEQRSLARSIDEAMPDKPTFGVLQWRQMLIGFATGIIDYFQQFDLGGGLTLSLADSGGVQSLTVKDSQQKELVSIQFNQGTVLVKASVKLTLDAPSIDLVQGAGHAAVFGDQLASYLGSLATAINAHQHPNQTAEIGGVSYPVTATAASPQVPDPNGEALLSKILKQG